MHFAKVIILLYKLKFLFDNVGIAELVPMAAAWIYF